MVPGAGRKIGTRYSVSGGIGFCLGIWRGKHPSAFAAVIGLIPCIPYSGSRGRIDALGANHVLISSLSLKQIEFDGLRVGGGIAGQIEVEIPDEVLQRFLAAQWGNFVVEEPL